MNLIPFPRLHYLLPSYGPLVAEGHAAYQGSTVNELVGSCVPPLLLVVSFQPGTNAIPLPLAITFPRRLQPLRPAQPSCRVRPALRAVFDSRDNLPWAAVRAGGGNCRRAAAEQKF